MARPQKNTERINVFFAPETLEKLKKEAERKGTNVSGLIRMIVLEYFQKK
jgi:predicted DNA binding CopG/RHH family protein